MVLPALAVDEFPPDFIFGAATSSYQIEGAWDEGGKGESIWDKYVHETPSPIADNSTGDISANSYYLWNEDVRIASELGLNFYRISISWPRILPTGFSNEINQEGVAYYNNLINGLLEVGIEPVVTLWHWDLPEIIQEFGGWINPLIADWFGDYSRVAYSLFGDRVKTWLTFNEPSIICEFGYGLGTLAPGVKEDKLSPYICNKNMLLSHARAYRIYDREFRVTYGGRVSIANNIPWYEPLTPADAYLAELSMQNAAGRYTYPIFSRRGGWPPEIESLIYDISIREGYHSSRLPKFTAKEKNFIKGTADFFGLNYYTTRIVRKTNPGEDVGASKATGFPEIGAVYEIPGDSNFGASSPNIYAKGLRSLLSWIKKSYGNIIIWVTENGYAGNDLELNDFERIQYIKDHLEQINLSIQKDGVNVIGYTFWSLIDSFEWDAGYTKRYGLYKVDFDDPERKRVERLSAHFYKCLIKHRTINVPDTCYNSQSRSTRQTLPTLPTMSNVSNNIQALKEIYENRRCIVKVFVLFTHLVALMESNKNSVGIFPKTYER